MNRGNICCKKGMEKENVSVKENKIKLIEQKLEMKRVKTIFEKNRQIFKNIQSKSTDQQMHPSQMFNWFLNTPLELSTKFIPPKTFCLDAENIFESYNITNETLYHEFI